MNDLIVVGTLDSADCQVYSQMTALFDSAELQDVQASVKTTADLDAGLRQLASGDADLLAIPATLVHGQESQITQSGCTVIGARTPRRPNMVLVSPNRLFYQPKSAIIVSDSELVRRQLLRARPDIMVMGPEEVLTPAKVDHLPAGEIDRANWLGEQLDAGHIDGFVISRAVYETSGQTERRHTLMPFPKERGGAHFLPKPYSDLIALIARSAFPLALADRVTELEGNTALWVQSRIMGALDEELLEIIGIQVRHRQVGSLLRQAEEEKDLVLMDSCHNSEGEVIEDEVRVEIRLEIVSKDGSRTLAFDRIVARSDYQHSIVSMIRDWDKLVKEATRNVPKDHLSDADAPPFIPVGDS